MSADEIVDISNNQNENISTDFGPDPVDVKCGECERKGLTVIEYKSGLLTWGICVLLLFMGLWLGCFAIPFCMKSLKDCIHKCQHCKTELGRFHRYEFER